MMRDEDLSALFAKFRKVDGANFFQRPRIRQDGIPSPPDEFYQLDEPQRKEVQLMLNSGETRAKMFQFQGITFCVTPISDNGTRGYNIRAVVTPSGPPAVAQAIAPVEVAEKPEDAPRQHRSSWLLAPFVITLLVLAAIAIVMPGTSTQLGAFSTPVPAEPEPQPSLQQLHAEWLAQLQPSREDNQRANQKLVDDLEHLSRQLSDVGTQLARLHSTNQIAQAELTLQQQDLLKQIKEMKKSQDQSATKADIDQLKTLLPKKSLESPPLRQGSTYEQPNRTLGRQPNGT